MHALPIFFNILMAFQRLNDITKKKIIVLIIYKKNLKSFYCKLLRIWKIARKILVNALLIYVNVMINLFKTLYII